MTGSVSIEIANESGVGVDEADLVKTDGYYIYNLNGNRLHVFGVPRFGDLDPLSTTIIEGWPQQMLIAGDRAAIFCGLGANGGEEGFVVDPIGHDTALAADMHLKLLPGTDAALAFAFLNVMREKGLVDQAFLDAHVLGTEELDAAILLAPVGALVPKALRDVVKGGIVVCGGIHMSDIPQFPYDILWGERRICSVANLTRQDGRDFIKLAQEVPVRTTVTPFPLARANEALTALREGALSGAAVLTMT